MRKIGSKPCQKCGQPALGYPRKNGRQLYYPRLCDTCRAAHGKGDSHPQWSGGRHLTKDGYVRVAVSPGKRDLEHRVVWRQAHGPIPRGFHVHHKNKDKTDNRIENLVLLSNADHQEIHRPERELGARWSLLHEACWYCGTTERPHCANGLCRPCYARAWLREHGPGRDRVWRKGDRWALYHDACVNCGTTERRHEARGLCTQCYGRFKGPR